MKKLFLLLLFFGFCGSAQAADIYFAQASAGGNTGANCANARAASTHVIGDDVAGNILHLCGTVTSTFTFLASGTTGNPITLKFETGAKLSQPFAPSNGLLNMNGKAWWVVDGGVPCGLDAQLNIIPESTCNGIIEATANGTNLANHQGTNPGVEAANTDNVEIKNIDIRNIYVRTSNADENPDDNTPAGIRMPNATNMHIHDMKGHDANWFYWSVQCSGNTSNIEIDHVDVYNINHGLAVGVCANSASNIKFHDFHIGAMVNWDDPVGNKYHHDGAHIYVVQVGGTITGVSIYNGLMDGDWGTFTSAHIFMEGSISATIFNNVFNPIAGQHMSNGSIYNINSNGSDVKNIKLYNNTFIYNGDDTNGSLIELGGTVDVRNNALILSQTNNGVLGYSAGSTGTWNFNAYASVTPGGQIFSLSGGGPNTTYTAWKAAGRDTSSPGIQAPPMGINTTTGVPSAASVLVNAGTPLTSLGIAALNMDRAGNARPVSGNWTIGAYNANTGTVQAVLTPSSNNYGNVVQHVTSSPVTFTLTNPSGTANLILSTPCCSTSGTNGPDFVISSKTCTDGQVLRPGIDSCTISVTFTPNIVGAESGVLQTGGNATGTAALSGTGTAPATAAVNITPNPVPFPNQNVGSTSLAVTITVTNTGLANLVLNNPTYFTITPSGEFVRTGGTCGPGSVIPPNQQCTILATFTPSASGARSATLAVIGNASGSATLNGNGVVVGSPSLTITPTSFNFGNVVKGTTSTLQNFTITNVGSADAIPASPFFSFTGGSNPNDFARVSPGGADCVPGTPIPPSGTCLISVAFTPSTSGFESGGLNILSNAATVNSSLSGTGTFPIVTITPVSPIAFGSFNQGTPSPAKVLTITNTGNATLTVPTLSVTGPTAPYFVIQSNTCTVPLAPTSSCTASVVFTPGSAGNFTDTFNAIGNASGSATLTGTGVSTAPVITLTPRPVQFPTQVTGTTSGIVTATVTNTGNALETFGAITISTGDASDFTRVPGGCGATLAAGATCPLTFTFTPSGVPRTETTLLTVNGTSTATVTMTGVGIAAGTGGAPIPLVIATRIDLFPMPKITLTGKNFVAANKVTIDGVAQATVCTATTCTAQLGQSVLLQPGFGVIGHSIGVK